MRDEVALRIRHERLGQGQGSTDWNRVGRIRIELLDSTPDCHFGWTILVVKGGARRVLKVVLDGAPRARLAGDDNELHRYGYSITAKTARTLPEILGALS